MAMRTQLPLLAFFLLASSSVGRSDPPLADGDPSRLFGGMDTSVAPGQNFFQYANGAWSAHTEIPADRSSFGTGEELEELCTQRTADLIRSAASSAPLAGSDVRKIADYYSSFLDEDVIERKGVTPLKAVFARIAAVKDRRSLARYLGTTLRADVDVLNNTKLTTGNFLGLWIAQDLDYGR